MKRESINNNPTFWKLFFLFMKISLFSFGGGNAMFPIIKRYCVDKYNWITEKDIDDILVVTNSIPGASAVEAISYITYKLTRSKWKTFLLVTISLLPHTILFFAIFYLGIKYIPIQYLKIIYISVIPVIIALLINMTVRYCKVEKSIFPVTIHWLIFIITLSFCVFVPVPWNIPVLIIIFFMILLLIYNIFKKKEGNK